MSKNTKLYAKYNTFNPQSQSQNSSNASSSSRVVMEFQNMEHKKKLLNDNTIVCIDIYGNYCGPCKQIAPKFAEMAIKYNSPGRCLLAKENVELSLNSEYQVTGVPAFIFYKNGHILRDYKTGKIVDVVGGDLKRVSEILEDLLNGK